MVKVNKDLLVLYGHMFYVTIIENIQDISCFILIYPFDENIEIGCLHLYLIYCVYLWHVLQVNVVDILDGSIVLLY